MSDGGSTARQTDVRSGSRTNMFIAATLCWGMHRNPARVRNMSPTGALVEAPVLPPPGTRVHLLRGSFSAEGRVAWTESNRCGVRLTSRIEVREWLAPPGNGEQQRVDQIVALVKAGAVPLPAGSLTSRVPLPDLLSGEQLSRDLGLVSELIENLGDHLASEPETLMRHATKLQNLDIAMQILSALSNELLAKDGENSTRMARIEDLRTSGSQALTK